MPPPEPEQAGQLTQRAQTLLDLGRPQEAVTVLLQALSQTPGHVRALALLSLAHGNTGDHREALRWADQAVAAAPDGEWGHRLRAIHLLNLNAPQDALRAAEEAVRLEPQTPEALQTLARTQLRRNHMRNAEATAERLRALTPDSYLAYEVLGLIAIRRQKWRAAEAHCRRALALRPNSYYALNNLGVALSRTASPYRSSADGRFLAAIDCLHHAVQVNPTEPLARTNLAHTISRYLFLQAPALLYFPVAYGLSSLPEKAVPFFLMGLGVALGGVLIVGYRRYRSLPPAVRDHWRRTRRQRWAWRAEVRAIREGWVKRKH